MSHLLVWTDNLQDINKTQYSLDECKLAELYLEARFGKDWFNAEMDEPAIKRHPLFNYWHSTGTPTINYIVALSKDIELVKNREGFAPFVSRLKDNVEFESARYELLMAASFLRTGKYQVLEFSPQVGSNMADFRIKTDDGWVFFECTKMSQSKEERQFEVTSNIIKKRIDTILKRQQRYYCDIKLYFKIKPDPHIIEVAITSIINLLEKYQDRYLKYSAEDYFSEILPLRPIMVNADYSKTVNMGGLTQDGLDMKWEFDRSGNPCSTFLMTPNIILENPYKLCIQQQISKDENARIKNKLNIVTKQLPENENNVVCVGMTYNQCAEKMYPLVLERHLKENINTRISQIILTRETSIVDVKIGCRNLLTVVPIVNKYAKKKIAVGTLVMRPNGLIVTQDFIGFNQTEHPCYKWVSIHTESKMLESMFMK
jgi:hypothetical protein